MSSLPPDQVAAHIRAFESEGEASLRARLECGTLSKNTSPGLLALKWLEEKHLERERDAIDAAQRAALGPKSTARWTLWIAIFTGALVIIGLIGMFMAKEGKATPPATHASQPRAGVA